MMKTLLCLLPLAMFGVLPSDQTGIYATIADVVLLPDAQQPVSVELRGAFAVAEGHHGSHYRAPVRGVLRAQLGSDKEATLAEWRDLQKQAGKGTVVSFGSRYDMHREGALPFRVATDDKPAGELPRWVLGGVHVLQGVEYGPARELALLPVCLPVDLGNERRTSKFPSRRVVFQCTNAVAADADLKYLFRVVTSDGEQHASGLVAPGKGITSWTTSLALQVGEKVTWSVHVVGAKVDKAPIAEAVFTVPAAAVEGR